MGGSNTGGSITRCRSSTTNIGSEEGGALACVRRRDQEHVGGVGCGVEELFWRCERAEFGFPDPEIGLKHTTDVY